MKNKIKETRESIGITQQELAEKAGVSRTIVSQLENGSKDVITSTTMLKISKVLDKPIESLFLI